jgi:hypothetical protein
MPISFDRIPEAPADKDYGKWVFLNGLRTFAEKAIDLFKTTDFDSTTQNDWKQPAAILNDWKNYDAGSNPVYGPLRYRKDINGTVHLAGLITGGSPFKTITGMSGYTAAQVFVLPPGYRPDYRLVLPIDVHWGDTAWTDVSSFSDSWVNFGAEFNDAGYYGDPMGRVHLRGLVKSGSVGSTYKIFTLPAGYRPDNTEIFVVESNGSSGECRVEADGDVVPVLGSNVWFSLDGITFRGSLHIKETGRLDIQPDGVVVAYVGGEGGWISLDGVSFKAV